MLNPAHTLPFDDLINLVGEFYEYTHRAIRYGFVI